MIRLHDHSRASGKKTALLSPAINLFLCGKLRGVGLKSSLNSDKIRTFDKYELEMLAKKCGLNISFYYMFPDYKFPKVIYTDESLKKGIYSDYIPYYSEYMNLLFDEKSMYNNIYENNKYNFHSRIQYAYFYMIKIR